MEKQNNIKDTSGSQNIFSHIKNITVSKGEYLGDEGFNNWMINRYLSMNQDYIEVVNIVQKNTWQMKGEHLYNLYKDLIPKQYLFFNYIKTTNARKYDDDELNAVQKYFEVSKKEAKEYINMLPEDELQIIKQQINGE